ncbi:4-hydroxy-tetrahydrodipicolinate reductase [Sphingobacteriales bacterium CHB3]|nr:4-hydroxy-tetrahydrodipicolinate reductase [Sphingobacteriales bacterium CHB3]
MNLALIGYGKMGKEIEAVAREKGITIVQIFDEKENHGGHALNASVLSGVDVCIDFSTPFAVLDNIKAVVSCGKNLVVGTTGWYDKLDDVRKMVKEKNTGFLYSSNFSLGVNIFLHILKDAAHIFDRYADYDVAILESHHNKKVDSPSGTALSLGSTIVQHVRRKTEILSESSHGQIKPNQLHISSTRVGSTVGKHSVVFDSECDTIELVHTAKNRRGLALGAVVAAEWLKGKRGFFTMKDVVV